MSTNEQTIKVFVKAITREAERINLLELRTASGSLLPPFTAGAHVSLHLPNGLVRSYSLCNSQLDRHRYVIGVNNDQGSRGGSKFIHETIRVGDPLTVSCPRNNFPLVEDAPHVVFFAGGVGITPLWSMIQRLEDIGRSWSLHYCARSRNHAAFLHELSHTSARGNVVLYLNSDHESGGKALDFEAALRGAPNGAHLYCCGPKSMIASFEEATMSFKASQVHVEHFSGNEAPRLNGGYAVDLAKSGRKIVVASGETLLDALLKAKIDVAFSCMEGVCGTCEVKVLAGIPDHRDVYLSKVEQASNKSMMVCCSGSRTPSLVLDL